MSARWRYWLAYSTLTIGIPLGAIRLLGEGHGTMLVWLGLLWIMMQIPLHAPNNHCGFGVCIGGIPSRSARSDLAST